MKRQFHLLAVSFILAAFPFLKGFSNNLVITNVTYITANQTVTFDLSWQNNWSNSTSNNHNWDAAWIFVKFRPCSQSSNEFTHGLISTNTSQHTFNGTSQTGGTTPFKPTKRDGTAGIDNAPDNTGVMLKDTIDPSNGTVNGRITLTLTNANFSGSGSFDVRVYGIEMVYVPAARFYAGDGFADSSNLGSTYCFSRGYNNSPFTGAQTYPLLITDTTSIVPLGNTDGGSHCQAQPNPNFCFLSTTFPKGYFPFYIMKYEISQGQYRDFLNGVNPVAQQAHWQGSQGNRYAITNTGASPNPFTTVGSSSVDRGDRACNWLTWFDFTAYCAWAALRPLSELEYEKAARGTAGVVPFEKAWGNPFNGVFPGAGSISPSLENGTETSNTANVNINSNNVSYTTTDAGTGPLRCGIFALSTNGTNRNLSGSSFYGVMDMSGNVREWYISVRAGAGANVNAVSTGGIYNGSGYLDAAGYAPVSNSNNNNLSYGWPGVMDLLNAVPSGPFPNNVIFRGGSFSISLQSPPAAGEAFNISNRSDLVSSMGSYVNTRTNDSNMGGRAGR